MSRAGRFLALTGLAVWASTGAFAAWQPPELVGVPDVVFSALCETFSRVEGFDDQVPTVVLAATRPLYQTFALRVLHNAGKLTPDELQKDEDRDQELRRSFRAQPVHLPQPGSACRWSSSNKTAAEYFGTSTLVLELSNPVEDPFAEGFEPRLGLFARYSIGGQAATWYWIALEPSGVDWRVAVVFELDIVDG